MGGLFFGTVRKKKGGAAGVYGSTEDHFIPTVPLRAHRLSLRPYGQMQATSTWLVRSEANSMSYKSYDTGHSAPRASPFA